jgi:hypothetical protein
MLVPVLVSVLPWQKYVSGLLQQYSVGSDDAFDDVENCKSHVNKQIMLKYADMVVRDMYLLSSIFAKIYMVIYGNGESKLQQCLNLSCDKQKVARFVSCDLWNDKHALVSKLLLCFCRRLGAFAMHIRMVLMLMFLSLPLRGAGPMALMLGHKCCQHIYKKNRHAGYIKCAQSDGEWDELI